MNDLGPGPRVRLPEVSHSRHFRADFAVEPGEIWLDPANAQRIRELIRGERSAGATIFIATHDMAAAEELCDRVAFIVDGRIVCTDSPRVLKRPVH